MPLQIPDAPVDANVALQRGISGLPSHARTALFSAAPDGGAPAVSLPHQVFLLNADDIRGGAGPDFSKSVGWRYLVDQLPRTGGAIAKATAEVSTAGGSHRFAQLQHGWIGDATLRAVQSISEDSRVRDGSFELRMLRIPSLLVDSLWLKNTLPGQDLFKAIVSPFRPVHRELNPDVLYSADDFFGRVRKIAEDRTFDNRPPDNPPPRRR